MGREETIMSDFRFAVAGSGRIARKFVGGLPYAEGITFAGAASRSFERSKKLVSEFSQDFPEAKAYASYEDLAADPTVDAVYVANLNPQHEEAALLFLRAGKAVLCEKPFALNAPSAVRMIEQARKSDVFLMEAMWTRFLPVSSKVRTWIKEGRIGDVIAANCDFGMVLMTSLDNRTAVPEMGGGALLDLGIYPVSYFSWIFGGPPQSIQTTASLADTGVDASFDIIFYYDCHRSKFSFIPRTAKATVAIDRNLPNEMQIIGTEGMIRVHSFWMADSATLYKKTEDGWGFDTPTETYAPSWEGTGYQYEAMEVCRQVRAGHKESDVMPLHETLSLMDTMDSLRKEWGVVFPQEKE